MSIHILVADDDVDIAIILSDWLKANGHEVTTASDGQAALDALKQTIPDLVFLDMEMPKLSGLEVLRRIRQEWPDVPVIIITAHGTISLAVQAMKEGAADFITKPFENQQLNSVVAKALERKELQGEVGKLLGEISHDVKSLLMPVAIGTELLESEISDLFKRLPEMEATKVEASHQLCDEVILMLRSTARRMHERMKEITDYVKCQSARPYFAPCQVAELVENVFKSLHLPAQEKGVSLCSDGLGTLPTIVADESRLYVALYNLVHNAIPVVPRGGSIKIGGRFEAESRHVLLSVEDTGPGMPPEVRDSLFTSQVISRKLGGTGLGTKIVRDAVETHGGKITVESTEGVGTTFLIQLPLRPQFSFST